MGGSESTTAGETKVRVHRGVEKFNEVIIDDYYIFWDIKLWYFIGCLDETHHRYSLYRQQLSIAKFFS